MLSATLEVTEAREEMPRVTAIEIERVPVNMVKRNYDLIKAMLIESDCYGEEPDPKFMASVMNDVLAGKKTVFGIAGEVLDKKTFLGIVMVTPTKNAITGRYLYVDCINTYARIELSAWEPFVETLDDFARANACNGIKTLCTNREGVELAKALGFHVQAFWMLREVDNG